MIDSLSMVPEVAPPSAAQFGLKAHIEAPEFASLGDTIGLTIHVTWTDAPHPWLLLPQSSPESAKLTQLGMSMEQTRSINNGKESPEILIRYQMLVKDTGTAQVPALTFDIPVQSGGAMHLVVAPTTIQVKSPMNLTPWLIGAPLVIALCVCAWFFRKHRNNKANKAAQASALNRDLRKRFESLASRVGVADPRSWMIDLEAFYNETISRVIAPTPEQSEAQRKLQEAFAQARYGGGPRDTWENKEWLRLARTALQFNREDQEENDG